MSDHDYPLPSFYFKLSEVGVDDNDTVAFQEVSGLSLADAPDINWRSGDSRYTFQAPKAPNNQNLICKRGTLKKDSGFATWCMGLVAQGSLSALSPKRLELMLLDSNDQTSMVWQFENAFPVRLSLGTNIPGSELMAVEALEFSYSTMKVETSK